MKASLIKAIMLIIALLISMTHVSCSSDDEPRPKEDNTVPKWICSGPITSFQILPLGSSTDIYITALPEGGNLNIALNPDAKWSDYNDNSEADYVKHYIRLSDSDMSPIEIESSDYEISGYDPDVIKDRPIRLSRSLVASYYSDEECVDLRSWQTEVERSEDGKETVYGPFMKITTDQSSINIEVKPNKSKYKRDLALYLTEEIEKYRNGQKIATLTPRLAIGIIQEPANK